MHTQFSMPKLFPQSIRMGVWLCLATLLGCSSPAPLEREEATLAEAEPVAAEPAPPAGEPTAILETDEGQIVVRLRPDLAPRAVENFVELAQLGFYTRTSFHRVLPGRMIQGGDPNSRDNDPYNDGQGNTGKFLPAEFSREPFRAGSVAMARQEGDPNSASSQFFIVLKRMPEWDGEYTLFGQVIEGLEVAEEISKTRLAADPRLKNRPAANIRLRGVEIEYR